ncbi:pentapeptide repeat-containing protein [Streptomyces nanhaiensis]|uniref:pentapeptide repeat-containing protein n=1 Tax=Streptomyces nanhaiensis TaxID=679319 RepID=UPI00399D32AD
MSPAARQPVAAAPTDRWTRVQQAAGTLAALGTLAVIVFTWLSIQQVDDEHALTREGQVTDRYNAAVGNIGDDALEVRLGGIYALQRIMEDSPRDQPSIINVLSAYISNHAEKPEKSADGSENPANGVQVGTDIPDEKLANDVQAALTALGSRDSAHDSTALIDLQGADLQGADLKSADLRKADLSDAVLVEADLRGADLTGANLRGAHLTGANLTNVTLINAELSGVDLFDAFLTGADLSGADLSGAFLTGADLSGADLTGVDLSGTDLSGAELERARR